MTDYRLAPSAVLTLAGIGLVLLAGAVVAGSVVAALADWPFTPVLVLAGVGIVALLTAVWWLARRAYVVRFDDRGYRVRLVRGVGAPRARWVDVADASTAIVQGHPCVVVELRDGRTSTIPVAALAADRDDFVTDLRERLRGGRGAT